MATFVRKLQGLFQDRFWARLLPGGEAAGLPLSATEPETYGALLKVAGRQPKRSQSRDCGCRLAALARGQRSRPRAGVQVRCALLGWRVRKRLDFTSSETRQNQGGEVESVPPGRGLCPVPGRLCSVCCGQLPCHTQASRWGGPGTGVAEPSDFPAQPGGQAAPYPVTLTEQILEAGRDITSPPRARAASRHQGSG